MELTALLGRLKLEYLQAQLDGVCEQAARSERDSKSFLARALEAEWRGRYQKRGRGAAAAGPPALAPDAGAV